MSDNGGSGVKYDHDTSLAGRVRGFGAKVGFSFDAEIGRLADSMDQLSAELHKLYQPNPVQSPVIRHWVTSKAATNNTWNFIDCCQSGTAAVGRVWDVRLVSVFQDDPASATGAGNPVVIIAGSPPPDAGSIPVGLYVVNPGAAGATAFVVPQASAFGRMECSLSAGERLIVGIKSATNGANYHVFVQLIDWDETDRRSFLAP